MRRGGEVRQRPVAHTAVAVRAFVDWLRQHVDDLTTVAVGIETPRGALVATLMEQGLAVFAVNPKQLDRFRDRHTVAGAKDDRRDARVLADSLRTDAGAFHRVEMDDARLVQLREFVHVEAALATDVSRLTNRLRDQVHRVQPALLALCAAADAPWFWTLWEQAPTVAAQRRLSSEAIGAILAARRIRRVTAAEVHAAVQAPALTTAGAGAQCLADRDDPRGPRAGDRRAVPLDPQPAVHRGGHAVHRAGVDLGQRLSVGRGAGQPSAGCDPATERGGEAGEAVRPGLPRLRVVVQRGAPHTRRRLAAERRYPPDAVESTLPRGRRRRVLRRNGAYFPRRCRPLQILAGQWISGPTRFPRSITAGAWLTGLKLGEEPHSATALPVKVADAADARRVTMAI